MASKFMTAEEVAEEFGITIKTLNNWLREGKFPQPLRVGLRYRRWLRIEVAEFIKEKTEAN